MNARDGPIIISSHLVEDLSILTDQKKTKQKLLIKESGNHPLQYTR